MGNWQDIIYRSRHCQGLWLLGFIGIHPFASYSHWRFLQSLSLGIYSMLCDRFHIKKALLPSPNFTFYNSYYDYWFFFFLILIFVVKWLFAFICIQSSTFFVHLNFSLIYIFFSGSQPPVFFFFYLSPPSYNINHYVAHINQSHYSSTCHYSHTPHMFIAHIFPF